ncbi:MAG: dihydrodipicolinate synthase family protein [Candidatus Eremiobacteraeota bacterium]|nr:dihydrodipicolinate synthase family protein [Candidatus Eremiobacteraeota bacterium]
MAGTEAALNVRRHLLAGQVIPAHPLALTPSRTLDERAQRALTRYYVDAGAGGIAVGVHTTQFAIHDTAVGLYRPVLELAADTAHAWCARSAGTEPVRPFALVAGLLGDTRHAVHEAEVARAVGYHAGLLSLGGPAGPLGDIPDDALVRHARAVSEVLPLVGFYLQSAVGGRTLGYRFWRALAEEVPNLVAIKIAPFDRYRTIDVVRAIAESGREDVALYTGNDDNIIVDLLTPFPVNVGGRPSTRRIVGGLLGQWAVWTRRAVELLGDLQLATVAGQPLDARWLAHAAALTDANSALFDPQHGYAGCIPGIHEVLRREGLVRGTWTLDPRERLSPGQAQEIDRVLRLYPELTDDAFVAEHRDAWLAS